VRAGSASAVLFVRSFASAGAASVPLELVMSAAGER
jgi:hypothetical protein